MTFVNSPDCTGESMRRSRGTGAKFTVLPARPETGREVLNFHPAGNCREGWNVI